jgi:hypothetical protein
MCIDYMQIKISQETLMNRVSHELDKVMIVLLCGVSKNVMLSQHWQQAIHLV